MSCPRALARLVSLAMDLLPRTPPPQVRRASSYLSVKLAAETRRRSGHQHRHGKTEGERIGHTLGGRDKGGKGSGVLGPDVLDGEDGRGLLVDGRTETGLVLDDDVRNSHLPAEGRKEDDELSRAKDEKNKSASKGVEKGDVWEKKSSKGHEVLSPERWYIYGHHGRARLVINRRR